MTFHRVADVEGLWEGELRGVIVNGYKILLAKVDGTIVAYEDRCAHKAVELSKGRLDGHALTCWAHDWTYDLRSGQGMNPRGVALRPYPLKIEDGAVWVGFDD